MYDVRELEPQQIRWLKASNIPRRFWGLEPDDLTDQNVPFPVEVEDWLESVVAGEVVNAIGGLGVTGVGLLFDGAPGLGKTTHAVVTALELIRRITTEKSPLDLSSQPSVRPVYYMTYPEFLSRKKAAFEADPETKAKMFQEMEGFHGRAEDDRFNVAVLVLDDLGKEYKGAGYNDASFDEILRSRYDKGLPTIITTNVLRENWGKQYGEAMGSFAHEAFRRVVILGRDLRKE